MEEKREKEMEKKQKTSENQGGNTMSNNKKQYNIKTGG